MIYTVKPGDTLWKISRKFNMTVEELKRINNLSNDLILVGQSLRISIDLTLPDGVFRLGSGGENVKRIQNVLASFGFSIKVDGIYGLQTKATILQVQQKFPELLADGIYGPRTKILLEKLQQSHYRIVTQPTDRLVLVNKTNSLTADYIPPDLVKPNVPFTIKEDVPQKQMRKEAAQALEQLFAQAQRENIPLLAASGYRSYDRQVQIFASNFQKNPNANLSSARPGESEHQTGLSMDVTSASVDYQLTQSFGNTPEGQWLKRNAANFGFIIRFPEGKETITGYRYEPWHIRYVGKDVAQRIMAQNLTLEEYLGR